MRPSTLYDHPALYDRLVPPGPCEAFYGSLVPDGARVLDLACGTGRLTVPLARRFDMTGLDRSPAMLAAARAKAAASDVSVQWLEGEMSEFELDRRFDLIAVTCNSLAHLTDDEALTACLRAVRRHLAPEGVFAFDVVNPDLKTLARPVKERSKRAAGASGLRVREIASYDPLARVREATWRVHDGDGSIRNVVFSLRQFFAGELPGLLDQAGLQLISRWGDFERSRFTSRSRLQVCLAAAAG